jgi:alkylation response protein AidB-like acyl-CoA dehydrogenase
MELSAEQRAIRRTVRDLTAEKIVPTAGEADRTESFPEGVWDTLADTDLTGLTTPTAYGGFDAEPSTAALVYEELAYGSLAVATALSVHSLVTDCIATFADEQVKETWLPEMADGRPVGAFALSEPDAGSNPRAMSTVARPDGDSYVIDGEKQWITNGQRAGVVVVFAKTDPDDPDSVTQFLVPKDTEGLTAGDPEEKLGLRASDTTSLRFEAVRIPERYRLTEVGDGLSAALSVLNGGRVAIAAQAVGLAQRALDEAMEYATEREQFDRRIGEFQTIRHKLAEMATTVQAGRLLTWDAAKRLERGEDARQAASMAKYFTSEGAMDVTNEAVQIHGGYGYTTEYPVERLYRDAKVTTIYEGTTEIQKNVIARTLLE